jgi:uncharacterized protein YeaO (DUF488 family)
VSSDEQCLLRVKRVYDEIDAQDGTRVLVDRLWPRGVSRETAALNLWCRDVAPSTELRRWFGHSRDRFNEFTERYLRELGQASQQARLVELRILLDDGPLTLLTATKVVQFSHVPTLTKALTGVDLVRP